MTPAQISEIQQRAEKAIEGPWILGGCSGRMITTPDGYVGDGFIADVDILVNANFIAHARQDIPNLLTHISELTGISGQLANENQLLRVALQDAIRKPMGVIPDSAVPFTL